MSMGKERSQVWLSRPSALFVDKASSASQPKRDRRDFTQHQEVTEM
jgi:hypothetical protein